MKLTYVSHACLLLESQKTGKVLTDPWFGSAYLNQWHVFPKPIDTSFIKDVNHIVLTHGHEDHLHIPTLQLMNKKAKVYFPYTWKGGTKELLNSIGFNDIEEVKTLKKIKVSDELTFTFVINGLDAFVVYEFDNLVVVNLNDALNASHWSFVEIFSSIIKKNWHRVDLLICGLGGASYFPNTVHAAQKDDIEIAMLREQFLAHKSCEIMEEIRPIKLMSFVPGFALLENDKLWINEMRFSRSKLEAYYKDNFDKQSKIEFINPLPGDSIENNHWLKTSSYHSQCLNDSLHHLVQQQYATEILEINKVDIQPKEIIYDIAVKLNEVMKVSHSGISIELLRQVNFIIQCKDIEEEIYIHCYFLTNRIFCEVVNEKPSDINLLMTTHTWKLLHAATQEWGGDVFYIGYGADIYIVDEECLKDNIDIVSIRVLSSFPSASYNMKREPIRALKYLTANPKFAHLAIQQKLLTRGNPNKLPYNERAHWVNKGKCDVCLLCDIPLLSDDFGAQMMNPKFTNDEPN